MFQGSHEDEQKIKKNEEDGFMDDFYCDDGFSCSFNFRNMPPLIKHVGLKLSALHRRVLCIFDALPDSNF